MISRRSFFLGASATLLAAPSIVRAASLMPVKTLRLIVPSYIAAWDAAAALVDRSARMAVNSDFAADMMVGSGSLRFVHRTKEAKVAEVHLGMDGRAVVAIGAPKAREAMQNAVRQGLIVQTMMLMADGYTPRLQRRADSDWPVLMMGFARSS